MILYDVIQNSSVQHNMIQLQYGIIQFITAKSNLVHFNLFII